ncbi:MAG: hypothetical protein IPO82_17235 [Betaproteobacteria bacterium]|nr:hypothetical protein [Betaproteobacteria bacterium]
MTTAQTTCPEMRFVLRPAPGRASAEPSLFARLQATFARLGSYFESYEDYFAEVERSLPMHLREARRDRREAQRLLLIAALSR